MNIVFATSGLEFNGNSLKEKGLGGSETALVYMARELSKLGNRVAVYCRCPKPGVYDGVHYVPLENFVHMNQNVPIDVQIISRFGAIWSPFVDAALNVFWLHDMPPAKDDFMPFTIKADMIFTLSQYHHDRYMEMSGDQLGPIMHRTSNGVDMEAIEAAMPAPRDEKITKRFIYSSLPERGLLHMVKDIWPKIHEGIPGSQLVVCGYDISSVSKAITSDVHQIRNQCNALMAANKSVVNVGSLTKTQLYSMMKSSDAMLYPCTFPEIFCITAVEAQGCGIPVVTSDMFALSETVSAENGALVKGSGSEYVNNFVEAAIRVGKDEELQQKVKTSGPAWVRSQGYEWNRIAASWNEKFSTFLDRRVSENVSRLVSAAVRKKDMVLAEHLEEKLLKGKHELQPVDAYLLKPKQVDKVKPKILNAVDVEVLWELACGLVKRAVPDHKNANLSVLEYCHTGCIPFAPYLTSQMSCKVTVVCDIRDIEVYREKYASENIEFVTSTDIISMNGLGKKFDVIFLADALAMSKYPADKYKMLTKTLAASGCVFVSVTPYGAIGLSDQAAASQKWSFDLDDLQSLFGNCSDFGAAFANLYVGNRGERLGYWTAYWKGDQAPGKINLQSKARRLRPEQVLTACIITKNEEKWIGMCLGELQDVVDQFVIGDCYSTDQTQKIATLFPNVEMFSIDFEDFSQARNETLVRAHGDWILVIDCDERMVNADKMRKFLSYTLPTGYVVRQNHLTLDAEKAFDSPVRLFRNFEHYRFAGCIHEHVADLNNGEEFGSSLKPIFELGEAEIAHYGYVIESLRKRKVILRNLDLLIKDAEINLPKGRQVIWLLSIRDYMNAVKWSMRSANDFNLVAGSYEHYLIESVVRTYHANFRGSDAKYHDRIFPIYQEAVGFLGRAKVPFSDTKAVPFQVALTMLADYQHIDKETLNDLRPNSLWFISPEEVREYLDRQQQELSRKMFFGYDKDTSERFHWDYKPECPDPVEVLRTIRERYKRIG